MGEVLGTVYFLPLARASSASAFLRKESKLSPCARRWNLLGLGTFQRISAFVSGQFASDFQSVSEGEIAREPP